MKMVQRIKRGVDLVKKHTQIGIILLMAIIFTISCSGTKDLTKGKTPQEIIIASSEAMQKMDSYEFSMDMNMGFPLPGTEEVSTMSMKGTGKVIVQPVKSYMDLEMNFLEQTMESEMYVLVENNTIVEYLKNPEEKDEWLKLEIPLNEELQNMINPANSLAILKEALLEAKIIDEEKENEVKVLHLSVVIKPDFIANFLNTPSNSAFPMEELKEQLSGLGNFTYHMWVRTDTLHTTKVQMDMGEMIKNMYLKQGIISENEQKTFDQISAVMTMNYYNYNSVKELVIPEEIKSSAKDISSLLPKQ